MIKVKKQESLEYCGRPESYFIFTVDMKDIFPDNEEYLRDHFNDEVRTLSKNPEFRNWCNSLEYLDDDTFNYFAEKYPNFNRYMFDFFISHVREKKYFIIKINQDNSSDLSLYVSSFRRGSVIEFENNNENIDSNVEYKTLGKQFIIDCFEFYKVLVSKELMYDSLKDRIYDLNKKANDDRYKRKLNEEKNNRNKYSVPFSQQLDYVPYSVPLQEFLSNDF